MIKKMSEYIGKCSKQNPTVFGHFTPSQAHIERIPVDHRLNYTEKQFGKS